MKLANLVQLFIFGLLFVAFALASNENSTNPNSNISNTYCDNTTDAETCDVVAKLLKAKREMSDAPTLLMYLAIGAIIVVPQIPQIDV
uniref:Uncharacterized protein n=1 Tax=viral metagenome TaxID=1070528 RepID=A0A6C0I2A7_9ZZZZ